MPQHTEWTIFGVARVRSAKAIDGLTASRVTVGPNETTHLSLFLTRLGSIVGKINVESGNGCSENSAVPASDFGVHLRRVRMGSDELEGLPYVPTDHFRGVSVEWFHNFRMMNFIYGV